MQVLSGPRIKSKPRLKSELRNQQYNVTLFDSNHLAHVIVLWQMPKTLCVWNNFLCLILNMRAISEYKPPGGLYYFGGAIYRRVICVTSLGGLFSEFCGNLQIDHARFCFFTGFPLFNLLSCRLRVN